MKYLIASDIHGSAYWAERLVAAIESQQPDRIVLLGDLLTAREALGCMLMMGGIVLAQLKG